MLYSTISCLFVSRALSSATLRWLDITRMRSATSRISLITGDKNHGFLRFLDKAMHEVIYFLSNPNINAHRGSGSPAPLQLRFPKIESRNIITITKNSHPISDLLYFFQLVRDQMKILVDCHYTQIFCTLPRRSPANRRSRFTVEPM